MKLLSLSLIALLFLCGCSWSVKPGQPSSNSEIEILVSAVPAIGKANDPDSDGYASIGGQTLTWAELDAYLQERSLDAPRVPDIDPRPGYATPVVIRSGPDTPTKLLQFATLISMSHWFLRVFWGLTGEDRRFLVTGPVQRGSEEPPDEASDLSEDAPFGVVSFDFAYISILCFIRDGRAQWVVNDLRIDSAGEIPGKLKEIVASEAEDFRFSVIVDCEPDTPFHIVLAALAAADEAGFTYGEIAPLRLPLSSWPKAVRELTLHGLRPLQ